jgi:arylsulfatase A-like enzyme
LAVPLLGRFDELEAVIGAERADLVLVSLPLVMTEEARRLGDELDRLGLRDNTIVVFTSDNGATKDGSNLPFRGGKHTILEGGTHLPTVISWPEGKMTSGTWDGLCGALDMFPTLMAMAGKTQNIPRHLPTLMPAASLPDPGL